MEKNVRFSGYFWWFCFDTCESGRTDKRGKRPWLKKATENGYITGRFNLYTDCFFFKRELALPLTASAAAAR